MNLKKLHLVTAAASAMSLSLASAQTFNGGAVADLANWSGGDPTVTQGTIEVNGVMGHRDPTVEFDPDGAGGPLGPRLPTAEESWADGFDVIQNGGVISVQSFNGLQLRNSTWVVNNGAQFANGTVVLFNSSVTINNGGSLKNSGGRDLTLNSGSVLTINTGGLVDAEDDTAVNSGTSVILDGGTFQTGNGAGAQFKIGGTLTVNSGILDTSDAAQIGSESISGGGVFNLNGGTISGNRMNSRGGTQWNFGGTTAGTFTVNDWGNGLYTNNEDRQRDNEFTVNFIAGSQMTCIMGGSARALDFINNNPNVTTDSTTLPWAEALWNEGQLIYTDGATVVSGADPDTLGWTIVTWADATNSGVGFGTASSEYFDWTADGFGGTLSLGSVPSGGPEIAVEQPASTDIANNGSQDFGNVTLGSDTSLTFTIRNIGGSALNLTGTPPDYVTVSGDPDFTVTAQPSATVSASGGTTTFTVKFTPGEAGPRSAMLSITNDDSDEDPFTINVSGTGSEASGNPYEDWATGGELFGDDANGDGVENGLAFLLGAASPTSAVTLPAVSHDSGKLVLTFSMLNSANRGTATLSVQHSSDLGIVDPWSAGATVPTDGDGVTFNVTPGDPLDSVTAEISSLEAASGRLFGRLKAQP